MIGWYSSDVYDDGLILSVQLNQNFAPQKLFLTRAEWAIVKREIDAKFFKLVRSANENIQTDGRRDITDH